MLRIAYLTLFSLLPLGAVELISFEDKNELSKFSSESKLTLTEKQTYHGKKALQWNWKKGENLSLKTDIKYLPQIENTENKALSTFSFWIYNEKALDDSLKVSFLKDKKETCSFDFKLNFTGWRTCWVSYERDMQGKPVKGMNELSFTAPDTVSNGRFYLDQIIPSSQVDPRHHIPDAQVPHVNPGVVVNANKHWMALNYFQSQKVQEPKLDATALQGLNLIQDKFEELYLQKFSVSSSKVDAIVKTYESYKIEGKLKPMLMPFYSAIYESKTNFIEHIGGRKYCSFLLYVARAYRNCTESTQKKKLGAIFTELYIVTLLAIHHSWSLMRIDET